LGNLLGALVLLSTVISAVGLGILAAYGSVIGVLNVFGQQQARGPVPVLVPSQTHASGD